MEEKVRRLEKKVKEANEKLKAAQVNAAVVGGTSPEPDEGKTSTKTTDNTQLASLSQEKERLRSQVTEKETEITGLKKKVDDLQGKYDKARKECEGFKNASGYGKDRTPKLAKDFTPKATLIKWVNELDSECGKWH